jgi:hypothetical protein
MHGFIKYEQWRNHVLFRDYSTWKGTNK